MRALTYHNYDFLHLFITLGMKVGKRLYKAVFDKECCFL